MGVCALVCTFVCVMMWGHKINTSYCSPCFPVLVGPCSWILACSTIFLKLYKSTFYSIVYNYLPSLFLHLCCPYRHFLFSCLSASASHFQKHFSYLPSFLSVWTVSNSQTLLLLTQSSSSTLICPSPLPDLAKSPQIIPTSPPLPGFTQSWISSTQSHPHYLDFSTPPSMSLSLCLSPSDSSLSYFRHFIVSAH